MFSFMNIMRTLLAKLISGLYTLLTIFGAGLPLGKTLPKAPADFTPVVRFAVCSDVHLNGDPEQAEAKRLAKLIDFMNDYSEQQEYKGFDALAVAGDFANTGDRAQYRLFNEIVNEHMKEDTQLLCCAGNHEYISYRDVDASQGNTVFREEMNRDTETHAVINGYHFILCSYCDDGKTFTKKCSWLDNEIKSAVKDSGDRPVFVFQHPAPFATVYGSISWGDASIPAVLLKYPQVIDFSGHSHYPVNDPRSIWQGGYTAFGCGTLSYFETELDGIAGNFPYSYEQAAQFYIVEADADGNVKVMPYDLITDSFFDNEYYLSNLADRNFEYSYAKIKALDSAPEFPDDTDIHTSLSEEGETVLTFTGAKDVFVTESYKVSVTKNAVKVFEDNFSGKYMYLFEDDIYDVNLGKLESGKTYKVQIVALNAYAQTSQPLTYTFTAE